MQSLQQSSIISAHRDVLEATISSDSTALLDELKRRGKAAVGAGQWPDAAALYAKAVQCVDTGSDGNQVAIMNANLSLCRAKMHQWIEAEASAELAVKADAAYVKGWWRLGQACAALQKYDLAVKALEQALSMETANKAMQKELEKLKLERDAHNTALELLAATDAEKEAENVTTTTTKTTKSTRVITNKHKQSAASEETVDKMDVDVADAEFTKSDHLKGYKIVNGKKTSYFHNELTDDAAKLIGDIAPKKLDQDAAVVDTTTTTQQQGTSAWNTAGTWEEKDCSVWATDTLRQHLKRATYTLPPSSPAPGAVLSVDKVVVAAGHASVAAVRGKKRYLYEYDVTVYWTFDHNSAASASGTMRFADIDGTCGLGEGYDVSDYTVTDADDSALRPILTNFCHQQGLRLALHDSIDSWVRLFKETY